VASGAAVTTSGDADPTTGGALAVDGEEFANGSRWLSTADDGEKWIEVDFGKIETIDEVRFFTGQYDQGSQTNTFKNPIPAYRLEAWNGNGWGELVTKGGNQRAAVSEVFAPTKTRKIRLHVEAGVTGQIALFEIEAWTPPHEKHSPGSGGGGGGSGEGGAGSTGSGGPPGSGGAGANGDVNEGGGCAISPPDGDARGGVAALLALALAVSARRRQGFLRRARRR
jgi:hypothetical protein